LPLLNEFSNWFDKQLKSVLSFFQARLNLNGGRNKH
jgi:hypothetical protein